MKNLYALLNTPGGFHCEQDRVREEIEPGKFYRVENVDMGGSHTDITLEGFEQSFNSVSFDFYITDDDGNFIEHNIYADPEYNPYLRRIGGW